MRLKLHQGVYSAALALTGAGAVEVAPNDAWVGWILIGAGFLLFLWGLKIDDRHWWAGVRLPWRRKMREDDLRIEITPKEGSREPIKRVKPAGIGSKARQLPPAHKTVWDRAAELAPKKPTFLDQLIEANGDPEYFAKARGSRNSDEAQYAEGWAQGAAEDAGRTPRMSFSDVVKRVAYLSHWAEQFREGSGPDPWKRLLNEICRPLTIGDIDTWGVRHERNRPPENGPTKIHQDFWRRAYFCPELMLRDPNVGGASNGEQRLIYTDIVFDKAGVDKEWPIYRSAEPSPFVKIYADWLAEKDREHQQWLNEQYGRPEDG